MTPLRTSRSAFVFSAAGFAAAAVFTGVSCLTSRASLSSLSPWKEGWRIWPSCVHSVKATSQSSEGLIQ